MKLENLRDRMVIVYGGLSSDYLENCQYYAGSYNDIFFDADNDNFYLIQDSIPATMSFEGTYIGAKGIGKSIPIADFSSRTNFDANGNMTDQAINANSGYAPIQSLDRVRTIISFDAIGVNAFRNGVYKQSDNFLGSDITEGPNILTDGEPYYVYSGSITRDNTGATAQIIYDTFTVVDEGSGVGLGFSGSGVVKHVDTDIFNSTVKLKVSSVDETLSGAMELKFMLNKVPMVNLDEFNNAIFGNADAGYISGSAVPLSLRYWTVYQDYIADSLKVR
ncbi:MAG: hypothetical protein IIB08_04315 [Bacteroidetes bacterium]|nr:hypothetical protein [Bacteroidota bacterium]